jgi:hypothetical protein
MFPYHPEHWANRGLGFWNVGYPELAAGDFNKARVLAAEAQRHDSPLGAAAFLSVYCFLYVKRKGVYENPGQVLPTKIYELVRECEVKVLKGLCRVLGLANDLRDCLSVAQEANLKYPEVSMFNKTIQKITEEFQKHEDNPKIHRGTSGDPEAGSMGCIHRKAYPWMTDDLLQRDSETMQSIADDFATTEIYEVIPSPSLTKQNPSGSPLYVVVARQDFAIGDSILSEQSMMFACTAPNRCPTYNAPLPDDRHNLSCCETPFCSRVCADEAAKSYHPAVCGRDFSFLVSAAKDSNRKGKGENLNSQYPLFLLRILACLFRGNRPLPHPLKHPSISRYVANYASPARFSFDFRNHIVNPFRMLQVLGVDPFFNLDYDTWVLEAIRHRLYTNARPVSGGEGYAMTILHPRYSMFNHSCEPNVRTTNTQNWVYLTAQRDIKKGEELFVSYIGERIEQVGREERRERLRAWLDGGNCKCMRCEREK